MRVNRRGRQRLIDNAALATEARFWFGRVRTAECLNDRLHPIDKQTGMQGQKSNRFRRGRKTTIVYVVKFTLRENHKLSFLKIGVTTADVSVRFSEDQERYSVEAIHRSRRLSAGEASAIEQALLMFFCRQSFRPPVQLCSGNTECFKYSVDLERRMKELMDRFRANSMLV